MPIHYTEVTLVPTKCCSSCQRLFSEQVSRCPWDRTRLQPFVPTPNEDSAHLPTRPNARNTAQLIAVLMVMTSVLGLTLFRAGTVISPAQAQKSFRH